jgi:hypothetical protein
MSLHTACRKYPTDGFKLESVIFRKHCIVDASEHILCLPVSRVGHLDVDNLIVVGRDMNLQDGGGSSVRVHCEQSVSGRRAGRQRQWCKGALRANRQAQIAAQSAVSKATWIACYSRTFRGRCSPTFPVNAFP